jgi:hypothetical protein
MNFHSSIFHSVLCIILYLAILAGLPLVLGHVIIGSLSVLQLVLIAFRDEIGVECEQIFARETSLLRCCVVKFVRS